MLIIASKEEQALLTQLRRLNTSIPEDYEKAAAKVLELQKKIADLTIRESQIEEKHAREDRELRHQIGLEKKRQEEELRIAKREAKLEVAEQNLAAKQKQFEDNLAFNNARFEKMEAYLKDIVERTLDKLPEARIRVERTENA